MSFTQSMANAHASLTKLSKLLDREIECTNNEIDENDIAENSTYELYKKRDSLKLLSSALATLLSKCTSSERMEKKIVLANQSNITSLTRRFVILMNRRVEDINYIFDCFSIGMIDEELYGRVDTLMSDIKEMLSLWRSIELNLSRYEH